MSKNKISKIEELINKTIKSIEAEYEVELKIIKLLSTASTHKEFFDKEINEKGIQEYMELAKERKILSKISADVQYNQLWDMVGGKPKYDIVYMNDIRPHLKNYHEYFKIKKELIKNGFWRVTSNFI